MSTDIKPNRRFSVFQSCLVCGLIGVTSIGVAAYFTLFRNVPVEISKETTYITEPLKSNGKEVDYFAALELDTYSDNIATDDNGFRIITKHLGPSPETDTFYDHFGQVCEKLGLDAVTLKPDMTYQDPTAFLQDYVASEAFDQSIVDRLLTTQTTDDETSSQATSAPVVTDAADVLGERITSPWTVEELPMMERWLEENSPALDMFGEAASKPDFCVPLARVNENASLVALLMPNIEWMRSFGRSLEARANFRIASGDIDGAIDDITTCKRLGRYAGYGPTLIQTLVGVTLENVSSSIGIAENLQHPPTKEQLQRLLDELDAAPPRACVDDVLRLERYGMLDTLQELANSEVGWKEAAVLIGESPSAALLMFGLDWNVVLKRANERYDSMLAGGTAPPSSSLNPLAGLDVAARSEAVGDLLADLFVPAPDCVREVDRRTTCTDNIQCITLAMLLYEADHGTLPQAYTVDGEGKPLHSWRVLLLPYLGQTELFDKIRLNEPWDSEHNRQFHDEVVEFYRCPSHGAAQPGETTYSVVVGPDMPFEAGEGKALADFGPESEDMILVVERVAAVCWMDPTSEITQDEAEAGMNRQDHSALTTDPICISSYHPGGANFGLRSGAVRFLSETMNDDVFVNMFKGVNDEIDY